MTLIKKKAWVEPRTHSPKKTTKETKFTLSVSGVARGGYRRELLPDPFSYYEDQGLMLVGSRRAPWRTTECRFHGGSDCMRIKVATGAFICMNCGARGGDIVAYHMAAHGLSFLETVKKLGAWSGGEPSKKHIRPTALSPRDAMSVLAFEGTLAAIAECRSAKGIKPSPEELKRILVAMGRINHIAGMYA